MVVLWIFASLCILGNEFSDFLDHKVDGSDEFSRYWECSGWPERGIRKYPCQDSAWYVLEFTIVIANTFLVVLLVVGMITRKYLLLVPWMIFRFFCIMVSSSLIPKFSEWLSWFGQNNLLIECLLVKKECSMGNLCFHFRIREFKNTLWIQIIFNSLNYSRLSRGNELFFSKIDCKC